MKTEERIQESAGNPLNFDAHEFDGLRGLEKDAQSLFAKGDQFVRQHPWLCMGIAAAAGFSLVSALRRK